MRNKPPSKRKNMKPVYYYKIYSGALLLDFPTFYYNYKRYSPKQMFELIKNLEPRARRAVYPETGFYSVRNEILRILEKEYGFMQSLPNVQTISVYTLDVGEYNEYN